MVHVEGGSQSRKMISLNSMFSLANSARASLRVLFLSVFTFVLFGLNGQTAIDTISVQSFGSARKYKCGVA